MSDGKLARKYRELAVRLYRLAGNGFDEAMAKEFQTWAEGLMGKADMLEAAKNVPKDGTNNY